MAALAFAAGLSLKTDERPTTFHNDSKTRGPSIEELDSIELADHGALEDDRKICHAFATPAEPRTPEEAHSPAWNDSKTPSDLERSQPPTPTQHMAASVLPSFSYPRMNRWRVMAACFIYFGNGMSDSAPGALIPYVEDYYHIGYAIVSLIWVSNAIGFILSAFCTDFINSRLGYAKSLMLADALMMIAYIIISCTPPFPVVVVAYLIMGFGNALNLALNNVFCANLADSTVILGVAQGFYGVGGIVSPIIATVMVPNGILWSRFFTIPVGIRALSFGFAGWAFWSYEKEGVSRFANNLQRLASQQSDQPSKLRLLGRALRNRTTLIGALFIFSYQGAEVSESGWFISYLINYRHGDPAHVGYVTSGFWAGITLGRFILTHVAHRVGEKRFVVATTIGCIVLQIMAWQIPNIIGDAVSVAVLGFLLGPVYPCAQTIFTRLLPANVQMTAISFISSAGSSGGAVVPFLTGLIAQAAGTYVLHPICVSFFVLMLGCWSVLPRVKKISAE